MSILGVIGLAGRRTRERQLGGIALVGYFHSTSARICSGSADNQTVYNSTYSTLSDVYLNSTPIFSDPGLTTSASIGFYSSTMGNGSTFYRWGGSSWITTGVCP